ncbi:MAG: spore coat protein CotJB [Firmicutes bacterium]|nr:spore coat protein CotJB [Bacillota bacterium]
MFFDGNDFDFGMPMIPQEVKIEDITMIDDKKIKKYGDSKLVSSKEGFLRGNMFGNLYDPYKDLTYLPLKPKNEKEYLLYEIMEIDFAINDINLYLDLYPEDKEMYERFKMYTKKCMELKDAYSKKYGPLTIDETNQMEYKWDENPWPWENIGGSMYV